MPNGNFHHIRDTTSQDPDGEILDYSWSFGDGALGEGTKVEYAYPVAGTYTVNLTVRDDSATKSDTGQTSFTVIVSAAPVADAGPDQLVTASVVEFDASRSSDADGRITEYLWDFGDGGNGQGRRVRHAYAEPGDYEVKLRDC